jgi:isoquinoline 1-oxidoreductase
MPDADDRFRTADDRSRTADDRSHEVERERYELFEPTRYLFDLDRRDFMRSVSAGILVLLAASELEAQESGQRGRSGGDRMPADVAAWLHIGDDGHVTVFTGKTEIGQNIRTSLTQAVAEELGAPVGDITLLMADTAKTPYDMGTFGSRTTPTMNAQLRKVAAAARDVLMKRAEARSKPFGSVPLKELVKGEPLVATVSDKTATRPPTAWTVAGRPLPKINGRDIVTGRQQYTVDVTRPGLLHAKVVRPPAYGATLISADVSGAEAMKDVVVVRDGQFIAVAAPTAAQATEAAAAVKAEWTPGSGASARPLFADLKTNLEERRGESRSTATPSTGVDRALTEAAVTVDGQYTVAYIAHAPLEPRAAVAEWNDGRVTVWTGTQRPFGVQQELADALRLPSERVRVIVPDTGSAYGGKHTGDAAIEAARIARAAKRPVKLVWTRNEEFSWAYFRPAGVIEVRGGAQKDGGLLAWQFHNYNSGPSGLQTPYVVASKHEAFYPSRSPLRQGSYRGLAATANHFARESHMDDLAHAIGLDPLAFRLRNLKDERLINALRAAAEKFGWSGRRAAAGTGYGLACGVEKGGYTAACAEIAFDRGSGAIAVRRIVVSFECGAIVNPDGLNNQVSGAVVQGLGGALFEAIDFEEGRLVNGSFSAYRVPRFGDVPAIDVVLLDRRDIPSAGAGETPIVGVAPAIANAIFDAAGVRLRSLPLVPSGLPRSTDHLA